jgi:hypothetical protein
MRGAEAAWRRSPESPGALRTRVGSVAGPDPRWPSAYNVQQSSSVVAEQGLVPRLLRRPPGRLSAGDRIRGLRRTGPGARLQFRWVQRKPSELTYQLVDG